MNVFSLTDDRWIDYCRSLSPGIPHNGPMPLIVPLAICCFFAVFLFVVLAHYANTRKRPATLEDFEEAYDRIIARAPFLKNRKGEDLRLLCRAISRDLLQITSFVNNDVAECIRKYHPDFPRDHKRMAPMISLIRETAMLRRNAIQIGILYHVKPLRASMVKETNETVAVFSTSWLTLLEQYCLENLQHDRFKGLV